MAFLFFFFFAVSFWRLAGFLSRLAIANAALFRLLLLFKLSRVAAMNALIRTTRLRWPAVATQ
jgi:hypothetical protein